MGFAFRVADVVEKLQPKCEDCVYCRLATHYGDDPDMRVHFARCVRGAIMSKERTALAVTGYK